MKRCVAGKHTGESAMHSILHKPQARLDMKVGGSGYEVTDIALQVRHHHLDGCRSQ